MTAYQTLMRDAERLAPALVGADAAPHDTHPAILATIQQEASTFRRDLPSHIVATERDLPFEEQIVAAFEAQIVNSLNELLEAAEMQPTVVVYRERVDYDVSVDVPLLEAILVQHDTVRDHESFFNLSLSDTAHHAVTNILLWFASCDALPALIEKLSQLYEALDKYDTPRDLYIGYSPIVAEVVVHALLNMTLLTVARDVATRPWDDLAEYDSDRNEQIIYRFLHTLTGRRMAELYDMLIDHLRTDTVNEDA